jgi:hypothetical protein
VRGAYAERYARMDADDVPLARAENDVWLAVVAGDLDDARGRASAWVDVASRTNASTFVRASAAEAEVALDVETGRRTSAVAAARAFVARARSWPRTSIIDVDATGIFLRSEAGDLDAAARAPLRARVIEATRAPSYGPALRRWYNGYAATSWTRDEAEEAIAHVPPDLAPTGASDDDYLFARVFALGGDEARAEAHFARASRSCAVRDDFYRTKAKLELASRRASRPAEACALYGAITAHWGASTSITAREAATHARALACPPSSDSTVKGESR